MDLAAAADDVCRIASDSSLTAPASERSAASSSSGLLTLKKGSSPGSSNEAGATPCVSVQRSILRAPASSAASSASASAAGQSADHRMGAAAASRRRRSARQPPAAPPPAAPPDPPAGTACRWAPTARRPPRVRPPSASPPARRPAAPDCRQRVGQHRQAPGGEARRVAIGVQRHRAHLRADAVEHMVQQRPPAQQPQRLVPAAHPPRQPAGEQHRDRLIAPAPWPLPPHKPDCIAGRDGGYPRRTGDRCGNAPYGRIEHAQTSPPHPAGRRRGAAAGGDPHPPGRRGRVHLQICQQPAGHPPAEPARRRGGGAHQGGHRRAGRDQHLPQQPARLRHRHAEPVAQRRGGVLHPVRPDPVHPGAGRRRSTASASPSRTTPRSGPPWTASSAPMCAARSTSAAWSRSRSMWDNGYRQITSSSQADPHPRRPQRVQDPGAGRSPLWTSMFKAFGASPDQHQLQRNLLRPADPPRRRAGKPAGGDRHRQALRSAEIPRRDQPHVGRILVPRQPPRLRGPARRRAG